MTKTKLTSPIKLICREIRERKLRHVIAVENSYLHNGGTLLLQMEYELAYQRLFSDRIHYGSVIIALISYQHIKPLIPMIEEIAYKVETDERNEIRIR